MLATAAAGGYHTVGIEIVAADKEEAAKLTARYHPVPRLLYGEQHSAAEREVRREAKAAV